MSRVCLMTVRDGRDEYHARSLASLREMMPDVDHVIVVDDWEHKLGFGGAIRSGWAQALATSCTHLFGVELDFTFRRPIPLSDMITVLDAHPHLAQLVLLRQPWSPAEREAGGIIQLRPGMYEPVRRSGHQVIEHDNFVSTNPALWPRWVLERGWPAGSESEGRFGIQLFREDPRRRVAYWGDGSVWVDHIGDVRTGHGY